MSFNKTEKFLELARQAATLRQGIRLDDVVSRYEVYFRTAQRMFRALKHQFPITETWIDSQGRKRWRITLWLNSIYSTVSQNITDDQNFLFSCI